MNNEKRVKFSTIIRALLLFGIIVAGIILYHYTNYTQYITKEKISTTIDSIRAFVASYGLLGPVLFIIMSIIIMLINIPPIIIVIFSVVTFGGFLGAVVSTISIHIAISMIYYIAQYLGRDFVVHFFGKVTKKIEARIDERGLMIVVYLRLLFFMFPPVNWLLSLSNISFKDYILGSFLGGISRIILISWASDIIIETIKAGKSLNPLNTPVLLLPACFWCVIFIAVTIFDYSRKKKHKQLKSKQASS